MTDADAADSQTESGAAVAATLERLNNDFYTADPDGYFQARWLTLLLLGARPDETLSLFADGITMGRVHVRLDDPQADATGLRDFVTMESQVLLHQVLETLLRLFLGHAGRPACPWVEIAGDKQFADFKKRVQAEVVEADIAATVEDLFLGGSALTSDDGGTTRAAGLHNLALFLRAFAKRWLDEAPAYNSLKHGLAVFPSAVQMSFVEDGPGITESSLQEGVAGDGALTQGVLLGHGPSLDFLESTKWSEGWRSWSRTTLWIDVDQSLAFIEVARAMIQSLWGIARARYTDATPPDKVFLPVDVTPSSLRSPERAAAHRWSMTLDLHEARDRKRPRGTGPLPPAAT